MHNKDKDKVELLSPVCDGKIPVITFLCATVQKLCRFCIGHG